MLDKVWKGETMHLNFDVIGVC